KATKGSGVEWRHIVSGGILSAEGIPGGCRQANKAAGTKTNTRLLCFLAFLINGLLFAFRRQGINKYQYLGRLLWCFLCGFLWCFFFWALRFCNLLLFGWQDCLRPWQAEGYPVDPT